MGLGDRLKALRAKLGGEITQTAHKIADVDSDSSSAPGAGKPQGMSMSEADLDSAGYPEDLR